MKRIVLLSLLLVLGTALASAHARVSVGVSFGIFYSSLDPYGEWITIGHGLYGWRPAHGNPSWRPYHHGRWVWTDDGWYWASDEPWAWAVYHYGRWHYDEYYGWIWIPGTDWAPAWVEWRFGGSCVGWAPLGPYAIFDGFYGIRYATSWVVPIHHWTFVDVHHMGRHDLVHYAYPVTRNREYVLRTESAGNVRYRGGRVVTDGPDRAAIERRTGRRIDRADVVGVPDRSREETRREGTRETIRVYRPDALLRGGDGDRRAERPERVRDSGSRIEVETRDGGLGRQLERQAEGNERRVNVAPIPQPPRTSVPERGDYQPARRKDDRAAVRTGRPEAPAVGSAMSRVWESQRGKPETGVGRTESRAVRPEKREEGSRGRSESRAGREDRGRR